jgi:general secretion pathway protein A
MGFTHLGLGAPDSPSAIPSALSIPELLNFYRLREQPFGITPDPRYLYLSGTHSEALAALFHGIEAERGFLALIAPPGMGKTTLLFELLERLQSSARTVYVFQTQCDSREFFRYLLGNLGFETSEQDVVEMQNRLNQLLAREMLAGKSFVLVIDEAQNLDETVLETVRLLSDFETPSRKLLQIVLAGQPQLAETLQRPSLAQLRQRISILSRLEPFGAEDTIRYIEHRLQLAGYSGEPLFTEDALQLIAAHSEGTPRNINNLCFNALSLGSALGRSQIDAPIMKQVITRLDLSCSPPKLALPYSVSPIAAPTAVPTQAPTPAPAPTIATPEAGLLSYPSTGKKVRGRKAIGVGVAAALLILVALFVLSREGAIGGGTAIPPPAAVVPATSTPAAEHPGTTTAPATAGKGVPAVGASVETSAQDSPPTAVTVIVQPGQSLKEICLQNVGRYDAELLSEISELNPQMKDPDHIEVGQSIWLPLGSKAGRTLAPASQPNATSPPKKH